MGRRFLAGAALGGTLAVLGPEARAQPVQDVTIDTTTATIEGRSVRVVSGSSVASVDLGCEGRATLLDTNRLYVACGPDGVVEIDVSDPRAPRRVGVMPTNGDANALFLHNGRVWVEVAPLYAQPVHTSRVAAAPTGPGSPKAPALSPALPASGATNPKPSEPQAAVPPPPPKPSIVAPPRRGEIWEVSALLGGFINMGSVAGGITGWSTVAYRFGLPFVVRAELASLGIAVGDASTVNVVQAGTAPSSNVLGVAAVHALAGLDTQFLELAVGLGGATLSNQGSFNPGPNPATGGPSVVTEGRFGARDGLAVNMEWVTVGANGQFQFGSFVSSIQVPLTERVMLLFRGGGGNGVGVLFGDLGARVLVKGDGGPGTFALTGYFGGAGINFGSCISIGSNGLTSCETTSIGGPSVGLGVEWRR